MITQEQFERGVQRNADRVTHYESGGDGSGGGCDCIGLVIGAIRLEGGKWPYAHGTNYTVRNRMQNFRAVSNANQLQKNELVFKAYEPGEKGYSLPDKYRSSGDLRDYYHVGIVRNLKPLRIEHCTSVAGGIKVDDSLGKWRFAGWLDQVKKNETPKGEPIGMGQQYQVIGGALKLRKGPGTKNAVLKIIPNGAIVNAMDEESDGWVYVDYEGTLGYCMARFLQTCADNTYDDDSIAAAIETAFGNVEQALADLKTLITSAL